MERRPTVLTPGYCFRAMRKHSLGSEPRERLACIAKSHADLTEALDNLKGFVDTTNFYGLASKMGEIAHFNKLLKAANAALREAKK